jgi:pimeloyl-ACP methyl ester carboxylesterase
MEIIRDRATPPGSVQSLLVLLPGAYMRAQDFAAHDFIGAVRRTRQPIDILAVDTGMESYLDGSVVGRLHDEAIAPACATGAGRIWLAGISLGGLGALLYSQVHPELVEGLLLMSPFIGTRGAVAEVLRAGGFENWKPPAGEAATGEHGLLQWHGTAGHLSWLWQRRSFCCFLSTAGGHLAGRTGRHGRRRA